MTYYFIRRQNDVSSVSRLSGNELHINIHNKSSIPSGSEGISVPAHFLMNVIVKQTFTSKLPQPYNRCEENPNYFDTAELKNLNFTPI